MEPMEFLVFLEETSLTLLSVWFVVSVYIILKQRLRIKELSDF